MEKVYYLTESEYKEFKQQLNEIAPLLVPVLGMAGRWALKKGVQYLAKKGVGAMAKKAAGAVAKKGLSGGLKTILPKLLTKFPALKSVFSSAAGRSFLSSRGALQTLGKLAMGALTIQGLMSIINKFNGGNNNNTAATTAATTPQVQVPDLMGLI